MITNLTTPQIRDLMTLWDKKLKIKKDIFMTVNAKLYKEQTQTSSRNPNVCIECLFGAVTIFPDKAIIFINKNKPFNNNTEIERTVVHELLHVKFPSKSEKGIQKLTKVTFK